jgi:hypothetical protein
VDVVFVESTDFVVLLDVLAFGAAALLEGVEELAFDAAETCWERG